MILRIIKLGLLRYCFIGLCCGLLAFTGCGSVPTQLGEAANRWVNTHEQQTDTPRIKEVFMPVVD